MRGPGEYRTTGGVYFRVEGEGEPLLFLHGLMVTGAMFDPLVELLRGRFRMLVPDLRGHGASGSLPGPYDVGALAADLPRSSPRRGSRAPGCSAIRTAALSPSSSRMIVPIS
jgi:pimeloyl-ACP methyl ester carboxylesterase